MGKKTIFFLLLLTSLSISIVSCIRYPNIPYVYTKYSIVRMFFVRFTLLFFGQIASRAQPQRQILMDFHYIFSSIFFFNSPFTHSSHTFVFTFCWFAIVNVDNWKTRTHTHILQRKCRRNLALRLIKYWNRSLRPKRALPICRMIVWKIWCMDYRWVQKCARDFKTMHVKKLDFLPPPPAEMCINTESINSFSSRSHFFHFVSFQFSFDFLKYSQYWSNSICFSLPPEQLILANLQQQQKEIDEITAKNRSGPNDPELNQLVVQLREKLSLLTARASQGVALINVSAHVLSSAAPATSNRI